MAKSQTNRVVFQPATYQGMQRGIDRLVNAIRPTLGPLSRVVAIDHLDRALAKVANKPPELLDSGGVIARRIIELGNRDEDMGAMLARAMICRLHEQVGDGTATAAVLFQSIYEQGVHYVTSGGNAMGLRHYLREALDNIVSELDRMTTHVEGKEMLTHIAESLCADIPLARMLGEIFDIIGEYGQLDIRTGRSQKLEREYIEGMYWDGGLFSREMVTDRTQLRTDFENPGILISDLEIEASREMLPIVEMATKNGIRSLVVVVRRLSEQAIATFLLANTYPENFRVMAVKTPGLNAEDRSAALEDLAVLSGGIPLIDAAGHTFRRVKPEMLGRARRAWATPSSLGIVGGNGDARLLRRHISSLQARYQRDENPDSRRKVQQRIGKLMGGSASLWIGGATEVEITMRKELAQRVADTLRGAVMEGVLPGGGVSLLACQPALERKLAQSTSPDERAAYRILINALAVPTRTIINNAGYDDSEILARIRLAGEGCGFDVVSGRLVDITQAGIFDATTVQRKALQSAVATAALALTIDVLVHHRKPEQVQCPG